MNQRSLSGAGLCVCVCVCVCLYAHVQKHARHLHPCLFHIFAAVFFFFKRGKELEIATIFVLLGSERFPLTVSLSVSTFLSFFRCCTVTVVVIL